MIKDIQGLGEDSEGQEKGNKPKGQEKNRVCENCILTNKAEKYFRKLLRVLNIMEKGKVELQAKGSIYEAPPTSKLQNIKHFCAEKPDIKLYIIKSTRNVKKLREKNPTVFHIRF